MTEIIYSLTRSRQSLQEETALNIQIVGAKQIPNRHAKPREYLKCFAPKVDSQKGNRQRVIILQVIQSAIFCTDHHPLPLSPALESV